MRTLTISVMTLLLMAVPAVAQQTHNQYEPANAPGAGQKLLAKFVGDWSVVDTFYPSKGTPKISKATCKQYMVMDGKFLESDFTFVDANGAKVATGTGISGFDPRTNRFTTVWFDSRRTEMSIRQSDGTFDGENIVLYATPIDVEVPGRKTVARGHLEDNGRVLVYDHYLIDAAGKERIMFHMVLTRQ